MLNEEKKKELIRLLETKFGEHQLKCPMCGNEHFTIADDYFINLLQEDYTKFRIDKGIPAISIICDNCGFISQHSLNRLKANMQKTLMEGGDNVEE